MELYDVKSVNPYTTVKISNPKNFEEKKNEIKGKEKFEFFFEYFFILVFAKKGQFTQNFYEIFF